MKVLVPGHVYHLEVYDIPQGGMSAVPFLVFMRRVGEKYPGNVDTSPGTNCQEVIRVLIDRVEYLQQQWPCSENPRALKALRRALRQFELRAVRLRGKAKYIPLEGIESIPTCKTCGHIYCEENH